MTAQRLRIAAVSQTLFTPASLPIAIRKLAFVQADPIRAPARAQDLILRHRVKDYRAGDLERRYAKLDIEEGILYAYGFLAKPTAEFVHPHVTDPLSEIGERVLAIVRDHGPLHPSEMKRWFGRDRVLNAWGGQSLETTTELERLRRRGYLRVVRRDKGIRVYGAVDLPDPSDVAPAVDRVRALVAIVAEILGPVPERTLSGIAAYIVGRVVRSSESHRTIMKAMLAEGQFVREEIDGIAYWRAPGRRSAGENELVRLLAPFDPIVWDRRRFEHLWKWEYRFEAYTPIAKRLRGYYALPLLWKSDVVGWANARVVHGTLDVTLGYVGAKPADRRYDRELRAEIERFEEFLTPRTAAVTR